MADTPGCAPHTPECSREGGAEGVSGVNGSKWEREEGGLDDGNEWAEPEVEGVETAGRDGVR